jgi:hypothetical protein
MIIAQIAAYRDDEDFEAPPRIRWVAEIIDVESDAEGNDIIHGYSGFQDTKAEAVAECNRIAKEKGIKIMTGIIF